MYLPISLDALTEFRLRHAQLNIIEQAWLNLRGPDSVLNSMFVQAAVNLVEQHSAVGVECGTLSGLVDLVENNQALSRSSGASDADVAMACRDG